MSAPIFISFTSNDIKAAERICAAVENRGLRCWMSARDIGGGENFQEAIAHAIRAAKVLVLVFSGSANNSSEMMKEIALAGRFRISVVPVRIEDVVPNDAFTYEFAIRQWIDMFDDWEHSVEHLVGQLAAAVAEATSPATEKADLPAPHTLNREACNPVEQTHPAPSPPLPDKPSIAVLPFQNMSGDPEQEYFVDGMVEEIITALSRIRSLFVIARNSTFTYKGQAVDVKRVGRELGVRYVLEGSARKAGGRVRITAQLIDAVTGSHLWADRFDGSLEDVFDLQDQVATSVAGIIEPALRAAETARSAARRTRDLSAYDLYLRALAAYFPRTKERVFEALRLLDQAIAIDPHYGPALAWAAICHLRLVGDGWAEAPETTRGRGMDLARHALQVGEDDPGSLANAAFVLANFGEDIGAIIGLVDRALALNPSFARGWYVSGGLRLWAGQPDLAIEHVETSLRLSPRERMGAPLFVIGTAYFFKHQFDEATSKLLLAIQDHPGSPPPHRALAACYAQMGRLDESHATVAKLRAITPQVLPSDVPYRNSRDRELFLSGLRLAMGEEA